MIVVKNLVCNLSVVEFLGSDLPFLRYLCLNIKNLGRTLEVQSHLKAGGEGCLRQGRVHSFCASPGFSHSLFTIFL